MTTYLATGAVSAPRADEVKTLAYCSPPCRRETEDQSLSQGFVLTFRDDNSYEFDETCANCGVLIPASS